jgi:Ca2+-binding RTX toxin-like protein
MTLDRNLVPGQNFDLDDWKLQLPVDANGGFDGRYAEIRDLDHYASTWFRTGLDGAMLLRAPVEGVTTGGSRYARTELRELENGANAAWTLNEGGKMAVTMQVDEVPELFDGSDARIVIGQVHGGDHQLVRLYYQDGSIHWINGRNEVQARDARYEFHDSDGNRPEISLDETFSYSISVKGSSLTLTLVSDGETYTSSIRIGGGWSDNHFYFKAGLYLGTNESNSRGEGQVSIYDIDLGGTTSAPAPAPSPTPDPTPAPPPSGEVQMSGTSGVDHLLGNANNNTMNGQGNNDVLNGAGGRDTLWGGSGSDAFVFGSTSTGGDVIADWEAKDQIVLRSGAFVSLNGDVRASNLVDGTAARDGNDFLVHDHATGKLWYDADGSGSKAAMLIAVVQDADLQPWDFDFI